MKVKICKDSVELGEDAAFLAASILNQAIHEKNKARLLLSTGASQFDTLKALAVEKVNWSKVEIFHLDEYVGLSDTHPASFRKYLKDRFINVLGLKNYHLIKTEGDLEKNIQAITGEIRKEPIDLALIGIGENAHIAFNDPPADFETKEAYIVVNLNEKCKKQQVNEGWFATIADVPETAVSMTVYQIMQSKAIISCVPYKAKAEAVKFTLEREIQNLYPATILKKHNNVVLFLDEESASLTDKRILLNFQ
jgi:glucosamine-6-phosphate deaminase